jgi:hypothetical protein
MFSITKMKIKENNEISSIKYPSCENFLPELQENELPNKNDEVLLSKIGL